MGDGSVPGESGGSVESSSSSDEDDLDNSTSLKGDQEANEGLLKGGAGDSAKRTTAKGEGKNDSGECTSKEETHVRQQGVCKGNEGGASGACKGNEGRAAIAPSLEGVQEVTASGDAGTIPGVEHAGGCVRGDKDGVLGAGVNGLHDATVQAGAHAFPNVCHDPTSYPKFCLSHVKPHVKETSCSSLVHCNGMLRCCYGGFIRPISLCTWCAIIHSVL